jgi:hypothetical protein
MKKQHKTLFIVALLLCSATLMHMFQSCSSEKVVVNQIFYGKIIETKVIDSYNSTDCKKMTVIYAVRDKRDTHPLVVRTCAQDNDLRAGQSIQIYKVLKGNYFGPHSYFYVAGKKYSLIE